MDEVGSAGPSRGMCALLLLCGLTGCGGEPVTTPEARGDAPAFTSPEPILRRLTEDQYRNSVADLFGASVVITSSLEPDEAVEGLLSVGASVTTISPRGVEQYEAAAFQVAEQVMADDALRAAVLPCAPTATVDDDCASQAIQALGRRVWRRPLSEDEQAVLVDVAGQAAETLGDFDDGFVYAIAALLQSPNFLFRVELGEPDGDHARFTSWEMASRLSYFLWNTTPDDALLDAAAAGELVDDAGLAAQVDRLLADDRARQGVRNLFNEMFTLYELDDLSKDPTVYVHMSDEVGPSAREETLLGVEALVFDDDGDYRDLLTTQRTFLDRKLAAIYNVAAPAREGFGEAWLPSTGGRHGLLGQVSFLAQAAHATASSPTLRGLFVREVLLCQPLPPPPANVNASLPEVSEDAVTMRDRLEVHREDPTCAACHELTDPVGLGLENFDGLGSWRSTDHGEVINATGALDGAPFLNAWQLGEAVADHDRLGPCFSETAYRYASGRVLDDGEADLLDWHAEGFADAGYRVAALLRDVALSPGFRRAGAVQ